MKNLVRVITLFLIFVYSFFNVYAEEINLSIIDIDSSNYNIVKLFMDKEINSNSLSLNWDIKLFKDMNIANSVRSLENDKEVIIDLKDELTRNTSYSILAVFGVEWTIDFNIKDVIDGLEILWDWTTWIEKVNIINSKKLKITFSDKITSDQIDIKILKEKSIKNIQIDSKNNKVVNVNLNDNLEDSSKYLFMLFSFTTKEGDNYNIENNIYDFSTKSSLKKADIEEIKEVDDKNKTWNVALNSAETPDTWAETWILILATFLLSNFIYFRKKLVNNN